MVEYDYYKYVFSGLEYNKKGIYILKSSSNMVISFERRNYLKKQFDDYVVMYYGDVEESN